MAAAGLCIGPPRHHRQLDKIENIVTSTARENGTEKSARALEAAFPDIDITALAAALLDAHEIATTRDDKSHVTTDYLTLSVEAFLARGVRVICILLRIARVAKWEEEAAKLLFLLNRTVVWFFLSKDAKIGRAVAHLDEVAIGTMLLEEACHPSRMTLESTWPR